MLSKISVTLFVYVDKENADRFEKKFAGFTSCVSFHALPTCAGIRVRVNFEWDGTPQHLKTIALLASMIETQPLLRKKKDHETVEDQTVSRRKGRGQPVTRKADRPS